jgi:phosphatidylglycerol:prolipoprotein diacylglycerol transferase
MIPFPNIDPVALEIGPLVIRWYALAYVAGIVLGYYYVGWIDRLQAKRLGQPIYFTEKARDDLIMYAVLGIILGGRIGYILFYNLPYYLGHPADILKVWHGGMSFHGGLLGIFAAYYVFARKYGLKWLRIMDFLAVATPIGLLLGRLANFINGELYGRVTDAPLGMVFPKSDGLPRHPSQLYEAGLEGLVLLLVLFFVATRTRAYARVGVVGGLFLAGYGISRFIVEFFRQPDAQLGLVLGPLSMGQLLCLPMILVGLWLAFTAKPVQQPTP